MPFDGVFLHHLIDELKVELGHAKIQKIYQPHPLDIVLQLRTKSTNCSAVQLLFSSSLDSPRIYTTTEKYSNPENPGNFCMVLRKYIERGIIEDIRQKGNDRIIEIIVSSYNELGDLEYYCLLMEIMGRNSNLILMDQEKVIIDAIRKLPPSIGNARIILPKAVYQYPEISDKQNPFINGQTIPSAIQQLEGCSKLLWDEYISQNALTFSELIQQPMKPTLFLCEKKQDFYCFDLKHLACERNTYPSLSKLLEHYYSLSQGVGSYDTSALKKVLKRKLSHAMNKITLLHNDLEKAKENQNLSAIGILMQTNLYQIKSGMTSITVDDFINQTGNITIILDPLKSPSENLKAIFSKVKKAENTLIQAQKQLELTWQEVNYLDTILSQLDYAGNTEMEQIKLELIEQHYLKANTTKRARPKRIAIASYMIENTEILVGKNNLQNEHLTHKIAGANDYWFHVKDAPGSHVIVRTSPSQPMPSETVIRTAANLAACFSKMSRSSTVPVDYTLTRYIKKIPGQKGYYVTYTNQKTIYIDPDMEQVKRLLK